LHDHTRDGKRHVHVQWYVFGESEMTAQFEAEIRQLLVAAFPRHADFFATTSYRGSVPEYRLVGRDGAGTLVAHLECGTRIARSAGQPCISIHHETHQRQTYEGPVMVLPLGKPFSQWPAEGDVDLQGMDG
jgi:hypothetical protein